MRRGDVVWVDLDPTRGAESSERRPAVIVSNDGANRTASRLGRGVVTVVPVTMDVDRIYPFQTFLEERSCGLPRASKAQAEQVRSVAVEQIGNVIGRLPADVLDELAQAIRLHLAL